MQLDHRWYQKVRGEERETAEGGILRVAGRVVGCLDCGEEGR